MSKFISIIALILTVCILSACAKSPSTDDTATTTNADTTITDTTLPDNDDSTAVSDTEYHPITKQDYLDALYGYYSSDGYYFYVSEDTFEKKNQSTGVLVISGSIAGINLEMADDGVIFDIVFYRNSYDPITLYCNSNGILTDKYSNNYAKITKEVYDSVKSVPMDETQYGDNDYNQSQNQNTQPWYTQYFNVATLDSELRYIDNLFAVGKKVEAKEAIQTLIFDKLDKTVDELIQKREYWVAYNYVAMYNVHVMNREVGITYAFLERYFEEEYTSDDAISITSEPRFSDFTQKYYVKILKAKKADKNVISKEDCLYKTNEFLLQNGLGTKSSVFNGRYDLMYFVDFLNQNHDVTDYVIICPYTGQIRHLPEKLYYLDNGLLYENALKSYL